MSKPNKLRGTNINLVVRERMSDADYLSVVTYEAAEMDSLFSAEERRALARGFTVTRGGCTWVDAVQVALKAGL